MWHSGVQGSRSHKLTKINSVWGFGAERGSFSLLCNQPFLISCLAMDKPPSYGHGLIFKIGWRIFFSNTLFSRHMWYSICKRIDKCIWCIPKVSRTGAWGSCCNGWERTNVTRRPGESSQITSSINTAPDQVESSPRQTHSQTKTS